MIIIENKGVPVESGNAKFCMSVVPIETKKKSKSKKYSSRCPQVEYHLFDKNRNEQPDVHKLVLGTKGNLPLFLDQKERRYLRSHTDYLYRQFLRVKDKLAAGTKIPKDGIPIPTPPKAHRNCIVCFTAYKDYFEHIESKNHLARTQDKIYTENYCQIDEIFSSLNSAFIERFQKNREPAEDSKCSKNSEENIKSTANISTLKQLEDDLVSLHKEESKDAEKVLQINESIVGKCDDTLKEDPTPQWQPKEENKIDEQKPLLSTENIPKVEKSEGESMHNGHNKVKRFKFEEEQEVYVEGGVPQSP